MPIPREDSTARRNNPILVSNGPESSQQRSRSQTRRSIHNSAHHNNHNDYNPAISTLNRSDPNSTTITHNHNGVKPPRSHRIMRKNLTDTMYILSDGRKKFKRRDLASYDPFTTLKSTKLFNVLCMLALIVITLAIFYHTSLTVPLPKPV